MTNLWWTDERMARLRQLHADGLGDVAIGEALGCSRFAVAKRRWQLKLTINSTAPPRHLNMTAGHIAAARSENDQPWEPMPGMVKRRCARCLFWFAAPDLRTENCPDCQIVIRGEQRRAASPTDTTR